MIPVFLRDAWARSREEEAEEQPVVLETKTAGDPVQRAALVTIAVVLVMACLWIGRQIAMPLVAGVIFGLVLGPAVDRLMRLGLPQAAGAAVVVLALVLAISAMITIFAAPFAIWSDRLPDIVAALQQRAADILATLKRIEAVGGFGGAPPPGTRVVAVEGGTPWFTIAATSSSIAGGLLIAVATTYFYLATRRQLKARALRLCLGVNARRTAGQVVSDIERKIAGYFGVITLINLGMGAATMLIAWVWGLPFPLFWGLMAFLLNYVAFIGPIVMTALLAGSGLLDAAPVLVALTPAAAYFVVHLIEGNLVTPLAVGRRLTVNPFLVFVSFVFWLWLWGPVGAFLATPILLVATLSFEAWGAYRKLEEEAAAEAPAPTPLTVAVVAREPGPRAGASPGQEPADGSGDAQDGTASAARPLAAPVF